MKGLFLPTDTRSIRHDTEWDLDFEVNNDISQVE